MISKFDFKYLIFIFIISYNYTYAQTNNIPDNDIAVVEPDTNDKTITPVLVLSGDGNIINVFSYNRGSAIEYNIEDINSFDNLRIIDNKNNHTITSYRFIYNGLEEVVVYKIEGDEIPEKIIKYIKNIKQKELLIFTEIETEFDKSIYRYAHGIIVFVP